MKLQDKSRLILESIAKGLSYDQILAENPACTYRDIFAAADEALSLLNSVTPVRTYEERMHEIQHQHPRAYSPWKPEEDEALRRLFTSGKKVNSKLADLTPKWLNRRRLFKKCTWLNRKPPRRQSH